jgi:hypothetical protein
MPLNIFQNKVLTTEVLKDQITTRIPEWSVLSKGPKLLSRNTEFSCPSEFGRGNGRLWGTPEYYSTNPDEVEYQEGWEYTEEEWEEWNNTYFEENTEEYYEQNWSGNEFPNKYSSNQSWNGGCRGTPGTPCHVLKYGSQCTKNEIRRLFLRVQSLENGSADGVFLEHARALLNDTCTDYRRELNEEFTALTRRLDAQGRDPGHSVQ